MAILFTGVELDSYEVETGNPSSSTNSTYFDTDFSRCSTLLKTANQTKCPLTSAVSEMYISGYMGFVDIPSGTPAFIVARNATADVLRIYPNSTSKQTMTAEYWDGSAWQNITSAIKYAKSGYMSFRFKRGASGVFSAYLQNRRILHVTGNYATGQTTWDEVVFAWKSSSGAVTSQLLITDTYVPMHRIETLGIQSSTSTHSAWNGTYAGVDEYTSINTSDYVDTDTDALKHTFVIENMTALPTSKKIMAVGLAASGTIQASSSVTSVNFMSVHSSTDYTQDNMSLPTDGTQAYAQQNNTLNPSGGAWSEANVNALEIGVISTV